jgi:two-component system OmpR family sensor kinase
MRSKLWWLALLPAGLGLLLMVLIQYLWKPLPMVEFQIDLGTCLALAGALLSLLGGAGWLTGRLKDRAQRQVLIQERLEQQEGHRRFLRRLDHQLKNPLTALRAALVNLGERPDGQALRDATSQADRLGQLVGDLRKLAELEERPLESSAVDVPALLAEMIEALQSVPLYKTRRVELVVNRIPWSPPPVLGDPDLLGLAFYNLMENALKYSSPSGVVEVRVSEDGQVLIVDVADSGPGISAEDLPHVFEELYRGANAHGLEGSGLGLALVQRVIRQHGGSLDVRSRRQAQTGTVFTVRLPQVK